MAEIVDFTGTTVNSPDPDEVLEKAKGQLRSVLIVGFDEDGVLYLAASESDAKEIIFSLTVAKSALLEQIVT